MEREITKALDRCLEEISKGVSIEASFDGNGELRQELEPLLRIALTIRAIPRVTTPTKFKRNCRKQLMARIRQQPAAEVTSINLTKSAYFDLITAWKIFIQGMTKLGKALVLAVLSPWLKVINSTKSVCFELITALGVLVQIISRSRRVIVPTVLNLLRIRPTPISFVKSVYYKLIAVCKVIIQGVTKSAKAVALAMVGFWMRATYFVKSTYYELVTIWEVLVQSISGARRVAALAVASLLLVIDITLSISYGIGLFTPSQTFAFQATLTIFDGTVDVKRLEASEWGKGEDGMNIAAGDYIKTGSNSHALITFLTVVL